MKCDRGRLLLILDLSSLSSQDIICGYHLSHLKMVFVAISGSLVQVLTEAISAMIVDVLLNGYITTVFKTTTTLPHIHGHTQQTNLLVPMHCTTTKSTMLVHSN